MAYSVEIQDTGEHKYCARALIKEDGRGVGLVSWTQGYGDPNEAEHKANCIARAHRFAASADLLAELVKAESFISGFEGDELQEGIGDLISGIRAAIAKAEGR